MFDLSNLPISGGFVLGVALYAGASMLAGQLVPERTIQRSGWMSSCEAGLRAEIETRKPPKRIAPKTDCQSMIG